MSDWSHIDRQLEKWSPILRDDLRLTLEASKRLATTIWDELQEAISNQPDLMEKLRDASPISPTTRRQELMAFQMFMDRYQQVNGEPVVARAQVIYQCYVCFVYLGDAWFKVLRTMMPSGSTTKLCCKSLTDNPVRAFRNAIAHGNWQYLFHGDSAELEFWARKGDDAKEPLSRFVWDQNDIDFWQVLARCVAYCTAEAICQKL
jgi:hypothetical protein